MVIDETGEKTPLSDVKMMSKILSVISKLNFICHFF